MDDHSTRLASQGATIWEDRALLTRLRNGDQDAFEVLVRVYGGRMLAVARRMLANEEDARDVVQNAFLSAFRALASFEGDALLSTWLHRIVINAALMKLRTRRRRPEAAIEDLLPRFLEDGHHADPDWSWGATAETLFEQKQLQAQVRAAVARLPESYRTVLMLRDIDELSTAEVAQALGVTHNAVKLRLHRARQALATLLREDFRIAAHRQAKAES